MEHGDLALSSRSLLVVSLSPAARLATYSRFEIAPASHLFLYISVFHSSSSLSTFLSTSFRTTDCEWKTKLTPIKNGNATYGKTKLIFIFASFIVFPIPATCPAHCSLFHLTVLSVPADLCKSHSFSLCDVDPTYLTRS